MITLFSNEIQISTHFKNFPDEIFQSVSSAAWRMQTRCWKAFKLKNIMQKLIRDLQNKI